MITIEIDSRSVMDALNDLMRRGQDMRPVMDAIGQRMEERVSGRFESKTDPSGNKWAPWKPSTVKSYPIDGNRTLLDRYGDMLSSLSHQSDAVSATIGFGQPYAIYHETGTKHMKRRGMLATESGELGSDDETDVLDLVQGYFSSQA